MGPFMRHGVCIQEQQKQKYKQLQANEYGNIYVNTKLYMYPCIHITATINQWRVLLPKLIIAKLAQKLPTFYGTRSFMHLFMIAHQ
jgi:hypothetical protein